MVELAKHPKPPERRMGADDMPLWMRHVVRTTELTPLQKTVVLNIATYDWPGMGNGCTAGVETLAKVVNCGRATVFRALEALCTQGLILRTPRFGKTGVLTVNRKACIALPVPATRLKKTTGQPVSKSALVEPPPVAKPAQVPVSITPLVPVSKPAQEDRTGEDRAVKTDTLAPAVSIGDAHVAAKTEANVVKVKTPRVKGKPTVPPPLQRLKPPATDEEATLVHQLDLLWRERCHYELLHPSPTRFDRTLARLRDGFTFDQLAEVIQQASKNRWAQGGNKDRKRWDDILVLFRSTESVEQWLAKPTMTDGVDLRDPVFFKRRPGTAPSPARTL